MKKLNIIFLFTFLPFCFSALALNAAQAPKDTLVLEFVPSSWDAWRNYHLIERVHESVFPEIRFQVVPMLPPADKMEKIPKEALEELKAHLIINARYRGSYKRFLKLTSLNPMSGNLESNMLLIGLSQKDIGSIIDELKKDDILKLAPVLEKDAARLRMGGSPIDIQMDPVSLAMGINSKLPKIQQKTGLAQYPKEEEKMPLTVIIVSGEDVASWAKPDERMITNLKKLPFKVSIKRFMSKSPKGKSYLKKSGMERLPAVILEAFDKDSQEHLDKYVAKRILLKGKKKGVYAMSSRGSSIATNKKETKKPDLKLFLMSECPYGVNAQKALLALQEDKELSSKLNLDISYHYIVDDSGKKKDEDQKLHERFRSLHGASELEENARQLVIQKNHKDFLNCYLRNRIPNISSSFWMETVEECKIPLGKFRKEYSKDAESLLTSEADLSASYKISSSPTFVWKDRYIIAGLADLKEIPEFKDIDFKKLSGREPPAGQCK
ncbi:hypothetical protein ACFL6Y_06795 [Elusimicrobiota bacterium]